MIKQDDIFRIGRIGKPHGVKGEVAMHFSDDIFYRTDADYVILDIDGTFVPFFFEEYRFRTDETVLVKFSDIDTTDDARRLTGCDVYFERRLAPSDDEHQLSWAEIIDYEVMDGGKSKPIGKVKSVDTSTINTLLEVTTPDGTDVLIPAVDSIIDNIDRLKRIIFVTLPEGLLDIQTT